MATRERNKTPLVGWHPPADLLAWLDAETNRRAASHGGGRGARSAILTEALTAQRKLAAIRSEIGDALAYPPSDDLLRLCRRLLDVIDGDVSL